MVKQKFTIILLISLIFVLFFTLSVKALTLTPIATKIKSASDYATDTFNDPWDMSNDQDVWPDYQNITNPSFNNGVFEGTAETLDPYIYLLWMGYTNKEGLCIPAPRDGIAKPIDADSYNTIAFRMYSDRDANNAGQIYWFYEQNTKSSKRKTFNVKQGWHVYILKNIADWSGRPIGLRIDPINNNPGANFKIDWFRLVKNDGLTAVSWDDTANEKTLYVDNTENPFSAIGSASAQTSSDNYNLGALAPGNYNLYLKSDNQTVNTPINVSGSPTIKITDPDIAGGKDFAINITGNPWDMNDASDIIATNSIANRNFINGLYTAINASIKGSVMDDPFVLLNLRKKLINTSIFHRINITYLYEGDYDLVRGTMSRVGWQNNSTKQWQITSDILTYNANSWNTLTYDLRSLPLVTGSAGWKGYVSGLRFDPHEDFLTRRFYIGDVRLAADDALENGRFDIKYTISDPDDTTVNLTLIADIDTTPNNGNEQLITKGTVGTGDGTHTWTPGSSLKGSIYIYGQVSDGLNSNYSYSTGPLRDFVDYDEPFVFNPPRIKANKSKIIKLPVKIKDKFSKRASVWIKIKRLRDKVRIKTKSGKFKYVRRGSKWINTGTKNIGKIPTNRIIRKKIRAPRKKGMYLYTIYATDTTGNTQKSVKSNWMIIR